jgi:hypothetical protein
MTSVWKLTTAQISRAGFATIKEGTRQDGRSFGTDEASRSWLRASAIRPFYPHVAHETKILRINFRLTCIFTGAHRARRQARR